MGSTGHLENQLKDMPFRRIATHRPCDQLARVQRASPRLQHMGRGGGVSAPAAFRPTTTSRCNSRLCWRRSTCF